AGHDGGGSASIGRSRAGLPVSPEPQSGLVSATVGTWLRQADSRLWVEATSEVIGDAREGGPFHFRVRVDVLDQSLQHEQDLWASRDIRVNRHRKRGIVHLAVDPVELVAPHLFNVSRVHESMAVWVLLDKQHRGKIVKVPVRWNLDQVRYRPAYERLHPVARVFLIVNRWPRVFDPDIVGDEVPVHQ